MITLLMLSGGIDSTFALYRLLRETDDIVHVHHVHLLTDFNRHGPEAVQCRRIVEYCRKDVRPFTYSESAIDHRGFCCHGYDLIAAAFEAGVVASSYFMNTKQNIDRWTIGLAKDDILPKSRLEHAKMCCEANCQNGKPPQLIVFPRKDLEYQVSYLSTELFDLTWSCRSPVVSDEKFKPCGSCKSCKRRVSIAHLHQKKSPGWTKLSTTHEPSLHSSVQL